MKARIVDIEDKLTTIKTEKGKFITIPRKRIKFNCEVGQTVIIEKNDDKIYVVPDTVSTVENKSTDLTLTKKSKKKHSKKFRTLIIAVLFVVAAIPVSIILINMIKENNRAAKLGGCIQEAGKNEFLKDKYSQLIECYKTYGGSDADSKIAENEKALKETLASECWVKAVNNYVVSDEEWENTKYDASARLLLLKRVKNGYEAQKACYKDISDHDISKIDAKINEVQSKIEYVEQILNNSSSGRQSFYCTTNTIGNYTYTSCY